MEDTCQIVPTATCNSKMSWQNILIITGLIVLFLLLCYFFYKFVSHTNKRFKCVEQALNQMNDRIRQPQPIEVMRNHFMQQTHPQPPISAPVPRPSVVTPQQVAVVDSKVLDKELMEELKELDESVLKPKEEEPEGRVDLQDTQEKE